jgi:hypothetical protein
MPIWKVMPSRSAASGTHQMPPTPRSPLPRVTLSAPLRHALRSPASRSRLPLSAPPRSLGTRLEMTRVSSRPAWGARTPSGGSPGAPDPLACGIPVPTPTRLGTAILINGASRGTVDCLNAARIGVIYPWVLSGAAKGVVVPPPPWPEGVRVPRTPSGGRPRATNPLGRRSLAARPLSWWFRARRACLAGISNHIHHRPGGPAHDRGPHMPESRTGRPTIMKHAVRGPRSAPRTGHGHHHPAHPTMLVKRQTTRVGLTAANPATTARTGPATRGLEARSVGRRWAGVDGYARWR